AQCAPLLALRELRRLARALQTRLLPLLGPRVAREQTRRAEELPVLGVDLEERASDAVRDRADLPGHAAALDLDHRVEAADRVGHAERRGRALDETVAPEVLIERLAVHDDGPFTRDEPYAGDRGLATTGPLEICG